MQTNSNVDDGNDKKKLKRTFLWQKHSQRPFFAVVSLAKEKIEKRKMSSGKKEMELILNKNKKQKNKNRRQTKQYT